ncbi:MAG: hypothetical protein U0235_24065 [Polyangiaceae bacterium]
MRFKTEGEIQEPAFILHMLHNLAEKRHPIWVQARTLESASSA